MPPRESTSQRTDIYSVLLVVAAGFLFLAVALTWQELRTDYGFMGSGGAPAPIAAQPEPAAETPAEAPAPAE